MNKEDILKILEGAKDKNGDVPMSLVRQAFEKLPESCTDTISRQDAIDAFWKLEVEIRPSAIYAIDEMLRQLPSAQQEQRWIPCSEKLPAKKEERYWICTDTGYQCQCRWTNNRFGIGVSEDWGWKIFDIPQYTTVVAWMSLPEPYKGE